MAKKTPKDKKTETDSGKEPDQPGGGVDAAPGGGETPPKAAQPGEQQIMVNAQYTKDLSFEVPGAPMIFGLLGEETPDINVNVNVSANPLQEKTFEVILSIQAQCKIKEQIGFILELEYAGVFTLNLPDEHIQPVLLIECPRLLFPFARNILADASRDGGFPPLMLGPIDFASMFQNQLQETEKTNAADEAAPAETPVGETAPEKEKN
jgi:preprotein translocase subunit SecB